ncbi:OLC1v1017245C1, partial [Oldenlandia corymbosa var. corymbosa]
MDCQQDSVDTALQTLKCKTVIINYKINVPTNENHVQDGIWEKYSLVVINFVGEKKVANCPRSGLAAGDMNIEMGGGLTAEDEDVNVERGDNLAKGDTNVERGGHDVNV